MIINNSALFLLMCSSTLGYGMMEQEKPMKFKILQAVQRNDAADLEHLLKREPKYYSLAYLMPTNAIDLSEPLEIADEQKKEARSKMNTYCNPSFYKDLLAGAANFGTAALVTTLFIAIPLRDGQIDFLKNIIAGGSVVATSTSLGIYHFKRAFTNQEAKDQYVRMLAIKSLLQNADSRSEKV